MPNEWAPLLVKGLIFPWVILLRIAFEIKSDIIMKRNSGAVPIEGMHLSKLSTDMRLLGAINE